MLNSNDHAAELHGSTMGTATDSKTFIHYGAWDIANQVLWVN